VFTILKWSDNFRTRVNSN